MRKPNTFSTRKPTDDNQVDRDLICPPVIPQIPALNKAKCAPRASLNAPFGRVKK